MNIDLIEKQSKYENNISLSARKSKGIYFTNKIEIIDNVLNVIDFENLIDKKILEPSCGNGIFLIKILEVFNSRYKDSILLCKFIQENLYFNDIDIKMVKKTEENISNFYFSLYKKNFKGKLNSYCFDYTLKNACKFNMKFDYIIGNPPYISLYGRRDKKKNEKQREYYLKNYSQFPNKLQNGKLNFIMFFIERSLQLLEDKGYISFILDISFFETAFLYTRKIILNKTSLHQFIYNINEFNNVASGQVILSAQNKLPINNTFNVIDYKSKSIKNIKQILWNNSNDEYKFRVEELCSKSKSIIDIIFNKKDKSLKQLYPNRNLRTSVMLLNYTDKFTKKYKDNEYRYPYYEGSKSIKKKYAKPVNYKYFYYNKLLQDDLNKSIKIELTSKGIKNKKRIGLGEIEIYNNPKVYIRQSAKEIIATFDLNKSAANNSIYVFSLRSSKKKDIKFLKFLTGFLNSQLITFFAQKRRIIRFNKGKQPQIKISDLQNIPIIMDNKIRNKIAKLVDSIYLNVNKDNCFKKIDDIVYNYYDIGNKEIDFIEKEIKFF